MSSALEADCRNLRGLLRHWQHFCVRLASLLSCEAIDDSVTEAVRELKARAEQAETELAEERARLDTVIGNCWYVHQRADGKWAASSYDWNEGFGIGKTPRAAIDAARQTKTCNDSGAAPGEGRAE